MKRKLLVSLLLVVCLALNGVQSYAWTGYTSYESAPYGYAGSFVSTTLRNIDYTGSPNYYLYRDQVITYFSTGTKNMPDYFERYTERGGYAFTDSVANPSNPSSYIIADSNWTEFEIESGTKYYRPLSWHLSTMTNQLVESSGVAHLRLRFMFDIYGTDTGTYFPSDMFMFRFYILK